MTIRHKLEVLPGGKSSKYVCYLCNHETFQGASKCPACGQFDTLIRQDDEAPAELPEPGRPAKHASKLSLRRPKFYSSGSKAWDIVLGGGFVKPSSVLVYGPRGVGKSTLALQIALHIAELCRGKVLYGSAEMPAEHVRLYAERLHIGASLLKRLWVQDSSDALDLLANIDQERPTVVVWDSIQRFTWEGELGDVELRQVVHHAIDAGKHYKLISILLSQVSKEDIFLGPNGIGHDVDVMVRLSRKGNDLIVETPDKNRFAPTPQSASESFLVDVAEEAPTRRAVPTIDDDEATREWLARLSHSENPRGHAGESETPPANGRKPVAT